MAKKSFRPQSAKAPAYPRLVEMERGSLRTWGLAAMGGLLLGGAACSKKSCEVTVLGESAPVRIAALVDAGAPTTAPLLPPGEPPPARIERTQPNQAKQALIEGRGLGEMRTSGTSVAPRVRAKKHKTP
jgi:hypothetical protein